MTPSWLRARHGGCALAVRVVPRSGRTTIAGVRDGALLLRVAAAPLEGAANAAVIGLLARVLGIPKRSITIVRGETGREKLLAVEGVSVPVAAARIESRLSHEVADRGR